MIAAGMTDDGCHRFRWAGGAWAVVISVALLSPLSGAQWPGARWVPGWLGQGADEAVHFGLFFVLAWLLLRGFQRSRWIWVAAACVLHGVSTEIAQGLIEGRSRELSDLVANVVGVGVAAALLLALTAHSEAAV